MAESHQPKEISNVDIREDELDESYTGYGNSQQRKPSDHETSGPNTSTEETKGVYKEQMEPREESPNAEINGSGIRSKAEDNEEISMIKISEPLNQEKSIETSLEEPMDDSVEEDDEETDSNEDDSPYEILENEEGLENIPDSSELEIVDLKLQDIQGNMDFQLKNRNDVYYEIYEDAKKKSRRR